MIRRSTTAFELGRQAGLSEEPIDCPYPHHVFEAGPNEDREAWFAGYRSALLELWEREDAIKQWRTA